MKIQFRLLPLCAVLAALLLTFAGCGASPSGGADNKYFAADNAPQAVEEDIYYESSASSAPAGEPGAGLPGGDLSAVSAPNRKIIWTVDMDVETLEFDTFLPALEEQIAGAGGYIESSSVSGNSFNSSYSHRRGHITARIPSGQLNSFLDTVGGLCNVTSTEKSSDDVTLDYVDTESRKASLEIEEERLLALLEQANDLETIIQLESRLSEVRYQLDSYTSTLRGYDSLVDYSTVRISISEVERVTAIPEKTPGDRIRTGFADSVYTITNGFTELGIWLAIKSPFLILLLVFVGIIVAIALISTKRAKKKAAARAAAAPRPPMPPMPPVYPPMPPMPPVPPAPQAPPSVSSPEPPEHK